MNVKMCIFVTVEFEAFHQWADAPEHVAFLRDLHRHIFHVRITKPVGHANRDIEFITLKREVTSYIREFMEGQVLGSCEMIASRLMGQFDAVQVEVSEDGENGAIVYRG